MNDQVSREEKTKAFERLIFKKIIFTPNSKIRHVPLDWKPPQNDQSTDTSQEIVFGADCSQPIPLGTLIPLPPASGRVLFIPTSKQYPIADCLLVDADNKKITVIQITVSPANDKFPPGATTTCLYDAQRYEQLLKGNQHYRQYANQQLSNYGTDLLALIGMDGFVKVDDSTNLLVQYDSNNNPLPSCHVQFLVITPQPLNEKTYPSFALQFPWFRVLCKEHLSHWLSAPLVEILQKLH